MRERERRCPPGNCPRLRFELFDSCARYKFSSFIHSRKREGNEGEWKEERGKGREGKGRGRKWKGEGRELVPPSPPHDLFTRRQVHGVHVMYVDERPI